MKSYLDARAKAPPGENVTENPLIMRVISYIEENYASVTSCKQIAEYFFISQDRLSHLCKECVGLSLWGYVILARIQRFNDLLEQGLPIEKAAYTVGFRSYTNLHRLYKKHMKISPMEYQRKHMQRSDE